jgi:membrane fusion protein (multidrug efflux system)
MSKQENQKTQRLSRIFFNSISVIIIVALLIWGLVYYFHLNDNSYTEDAQVEAYISPVNTRIGGYIKEIRFDENQSVKKGDTIIIIDDKEYQIQVEQALAAVKNAQAGKTVVGADIGLSANSTFISDANIAEAKARLDNQSTNLKRYENLLKADVIPQYQYDEVKTEYEAIKARYESLIRQRQSTTLSTKAVSEKLNVSDADIMRAKAVLEMARLNISYCYITAPFDGIMGRRKISTGQLLQIGQTLATIVEGNQKWVTANFTESQIGKIKVGDAMSIKVDALKGKVFEGRVESVSGATGSRYSAIPVDNSTGNFVKVQQRIPVRIVFTKAHNNKEDLDKIRAGMNVEVTKEN